MIWNKEIRVSVFDNQNCICRVVFIFNYKKEVCSEEYHHQTTTATLFNKLKGGRF